MPDAYTYIAKPTNSDYSYVSPKGKEQYDQVDITYDDSSVFYDGADNNAYTRVEKTKGAWNISQAVLENTETLADASVEGLFFNPEGSKMYILNATLDRVSEYALSTPWDVTTASLSLTFSAPDDLTQEAISFSADGYKLYVLGNAADEVNEYTLTTSWSLAEGTLTNTFDVTAQDSSPVGMFFKPDGTRMYICGDVGNSIYEYQLSAAWDISTAVYSQSFSLASQTVSPRGLFFKPDGTKFYVIRSSTSIIYEYDMPTVWDITSAVFNQSFTVASSDENTYALFFKPDGLQMYVISDTNNTIAEYHLDPGYTNIQKPT